MPQAGREYVQPQWVFDCLNEGVLLPLAESAGRRGHQADTHGAGGGSVGVKRSDRDHIQTQSKTLPNAADYA